LTNKKVVAFLQKIRKNRVNQLNMHAVWLILSEMIGGPEKGRFSLLPSTWVWGPLVLLDEVWTTLTDPLLREPREMRRCAILLEDVAIWHQGVTVLYQLRKQILDIKLAFRNRVCWHTCIQQQGVLNKL